ncbi:MAG: ABC transporter substrate-binding protein, partial [Actinomadura sp.]
MRPARRRIFNSSITAALAAVSLLLSACGSSSSGDSSKEPVVICGNLALSGVYAQLGQTDNYGATAYFKHLNATGGLLGRPVQYKV